MSDSHFIKEQSEGPLSKMSAAKLPRGLRLQKATDFFQTKKTNLANLTVKNWTYSHLCLWRSFSSEIRKQKNNVLCNVHADDKPDEKMKPSAYECSELIETDTN